MSECEIAGVVEGARLEISPAVAETMRSAGSHDDRLDAGHVTRGAWLAVATSPAIPADGRLLRA
jgi:hypothetical protein